ncbi:hypothetical protein D3C73_1508020 [compost metagenome]
MLEDANVVVTILVVVCKTARPTLSNVWTEALICPCPLFKVVCNVQYAAIRWDDDALHDVSSHMTIG